MNESTQTEAVTQLQREENWNAIDHISLQIDYHIIEHFSQHLYSSPNKAIEELVVNGYDAGAKEVYVYIGARENIVVWDDGFSMDPEGLKRLWKLADSPKNSDDQRLLELGNGIRRKIIGKFGIGKIASYTLGNKITHLCKNGNKYWLTSIDYAALMKKSKAVEEMTNPQIKEFTEGPNSTATSLDPTKPEEMGVIKVQDSRFLKGKEVKDQPYKSAIFELTEKECIEYLDVVFPERPKNFDELFGKVTWTCAIIDELKSVELPIGRLRWVLGNSMPLQPDFSVYLDNVKVAPNILKTNLVCDWHFGQKEIIDQLKSSWKDALKDGEVNGDLIFASVIGLDARNPTAVLPYVKFPNLGVVWGNSRLYSNSLAKNRTSDYGRSHGFFIMVRDRLINPNDEKFLLHDPSFSTFYSSQWIIHVDGLDQNLLADRERIQENSILSAELKILQRAIYLALAAKQRKLMEALAQQASIEHRFPVDSPEFFMDPLAALWVKDGTGEQLGFDYTDPKISPKALGKDELVSIFSTKDGFFVNSDHPYYQNLTKLLGGSKHGQKVVKEFEIVAVCEKLFEGFLYEIGINDNTIDKIVKWRDSLYRKIAEKDKENISQIAENLRNASHTGADEFENAIVDVLRVMGFIAHRDGAKGQKDVFVRAYCGDQSYALTFEAKGKANGSLPNGDAKTGPAEAHRVAAKANHAVIVSRKFAGFELSDELPAILKECHAIKTVSIMEVDALIELMYAVKRHAYGLENLEKVFTEIMSPDEKLEQIRSLSEPLDQFNYIKLLENIWDYQGQTGNGKLVSCRHIWQTQYEDIFSDDTDFYLLLEALRQMAYPLIQYDSEKKLVALRQSPENVLVRIQNTFSKP